MTSGIVIQFEIGISEIFALQDTSCAVHVLLVCWLYDESKYMNILIETYACVVHFARDQSYVKKLDRLHTYVVGGRGRDPLPGMGTA